MKKRRMMVRRAAMVASGIALTASVGLAGAGVASAAASTQQHIKDGSEWTVEPHGASLCDVATFHSDGTFTGSFGDSGLWSTFSSGNELVMIFAPSDGLTLKFNGEYIQASKEYSGTLKMTGQRKNAGVVVKGAAPHC